MTLLGSSCCVLSPLSVFYQQPLDLRAQLKCSLKPRGISLLDVELTQLLPSDRETVDPKGYCTMYWPPLSDRSVHLALTKFGI